MIKLCIVGMADTDFDLGGGVSQMPRNRVIDSQGMTCLRVNLTPRKHEVRKFLFYQVLRPLSRLGLLLRELRVGCVLILF